MRKALSFILLGYILSIVVLETKDLVFDIKYKQCEQQENDVYMGTYHCAYDYIPHKILDLLTYRPRLAHRYFYPDKE